MRGLYGVSARIRSAATLRSRVSLPSGERTISSATCRGAEAEVGARILGGEVAAPGVELAHEPAAAGQHGGDLVPGAKPFGFTSSQWPRAPLFRSRSSGPAIELTATSTSPSLS